MAINYLPFWVQLFTVNFKSDAKKQLFRKILSFSIYTIYLL